MFSRFYQKQRKQQSAHEKKRREGALKKREGALGCEIVITYSVAEVPKENKKMFAKNMTEAEDDALKMLSKTTENVENTIAMDMREG